MEEEIEAGMDEINVEEEEEEVRTRRKIEGRLILWYFATIFFSLICGVCIYAFAVDKNTEIAIPIMMASLIFLGLCIYYTIRNTVSACNPRLANRFRAAVRPEDVEDTDENGSSSPAPLLNLDVAGPSGLQASDSSTSSVQSTTLESGDKTSSSESKCTFTTTAVIESADKISEVASSISQIALETVSSEKEENGVPKPSTTEQKDPDDCMTDELASEKQPSGPVRQRKITPESQKDKIPE